jgi:hypothetical protein
MSESSFSPGSSTSQLCCIGKRELLLLLAELLRGDLKGVTPNELFSLSSTSFNDDGERLVR